MWNAVRSVTQKPIQIRNTFMRPQLESRGRNWVTQYGVTGAAKANIRFRPSAISHKTLFMNFLLLPSLTWIGRIFSTSPFIRLISFRSLFGIVSFWFVCIVQLKGSAPLHPQVQLNEHWQSLSQSLTMSMDLLRLSSAEQQHQHHNQFCIFFAGRTTIAFCPKLNQSFKYFSLFAAYYITFGWKRCRRRCCWARSCGCC